MELKIKLQEKSAFLCSTRRSPIHHGPTCRPVMPLNTERKENRQWPILACASVKDLLQTDARQKGHFCPRQFQAPDRRASQSRPTRGPTRQSTGTDARIMNPDLLSAFNERETCVNSQVCPYVLKHI